MNVSEDVTYALNKVEGELKAYAPKIYLFGSRSKGKESRYSDIDIAILSEAEIPGDLMSEIREKLEQSNILYKVDLVDLSKVNNDFRQKVLKEGILWNG